MMMMIVYDDDFLREQVVASQEPSHITTITNCVDMPYRHADRPINRHFQDRHYNRHKNQQKSTQTGAGKGTIGNLM